MANSARCIARLLRGWDNNRAAVGSGVDPVEREAERYARRGDGPIHLAGAGLRCVIQDARPPAVTGFGTAPDLDAIDLSGPFVFCEK